MANDIDKTSPHYKGEFGSIYEVNQKFPSGGVEGDYVAIDGWAHYWNADRETWCVNAQRDSYWDELITGIIEKFKLFKGATYMGVAGLDTVPAKAIGAKMYYFATVAGTYKNFGGLVVPQGINVLYSENGSSWVCSTLLEVAQELGVSTRMVVSQKVVNDALVLKANQSSVNEALAKKADKETVNVELGKKFDKESIAQESGDSEELVMSQKAVSDKLSDLSSIVDFEIGDISTSSGNPVEGSATLRTKEYIICTETSPFEISENIKNSFGYFYDIDKKYLGYETLGTKFYPKKGSSFLKIVLASSYGTVYKNDVAIIHKNSATQAANAVLKKIEIEKEKSDASIPYYLNNILGKEDFEIGDISTGSGNPVEGSTTLRTKEYIACSDEQSIFVSVPTQKAGYAYYYDDAKGFLGYEEIPNKQALLPKKGSSFLKIVLDSSYGTVYKNDVKIATSFYRRVLVVSKYADSEYNTVSRAVSEARSGDIVFVRRGTYDNEIIDASKKTISIIGEGKNETVIMGNGDYSTPPLQMASGCLRDITIRSYGNKQTANGRFAYAMHSDYDILANNTFDVNNCRFETEAGFGAVGFGLRGGCFVSFTNCDFIGKKLSFFLNEAVTKKGYNHAPGIQNIDFLNCRFICNGDGTEKYGIGKVMVLFEGYKSRDSKVLLTLIGNVFVHNDVQPILNFTLSPDSYWDGGNNIGNIKINSNGDTLTNWYITSSSCNNNVDELNRCKKGTINNLEL